jgi:L-2-hydroxyglutarate oxidase LhgO
MYDALVMGGGVIGLTIARRLSQAGLKIAIFEANSTIGLETSFRNSAVVHAGIYYPPGSLKAKLCVKGKHLLEDYCARQGIPYQQIGKLIVAAASVQVPDLERMLAQAKENGGQDLRILSQTELAAREPAIKGVAALYSPRTGIIDGQAFIKSLLQALPSNYVLTGTKINQCQVDSYSFSVHSECQQIFNSRILINAAGLGAVAIAKKMEGLPNEYIPTLYYAKGNYFKYGRPSPFKHLIYPLPEKAGLGIHATLDLNGNLRFGPDVEWVEDIDYKTNLERKTDFLKAISEYFPEIKAQDLIPDDQHTGIRPKILPADKQPQDFIISTSEDHGIKGLVNLFGIESPGLTSALAIADYVVDYCAI